MMDTEFIEELIHSYLAKHLEVELDVTESLDQGRTIQAHVILSGETIYSSWKEDLRDN